MTSIHDLRSYFSELDYTIIIAADGETRSHTREGSRIIESMPAGGVATAFDVLCQAADATYIARARTAEDRQVTGPNNDVTITGPYGRYCLERIFLSYEQEDLYYSGYANQTLWPICHVVFQRPIFNEAWFQGYASVNRIFADRVQAHLGERTFVWINDYQLALVPSFIERRPDTVIGMFWHIPWPTWEIFRIMPHKYDLLESLLQCDFLAFHRRYQARNFLNCVDRELGARIDSETNTVYFQDHATRVAALPMGIDVDVIEAQLSPPEQPSGLLDSVLATFGITPTAPTPEAPTARSELATLTDRYRIMLGVDRLDYTKGIPERLQAIDLFFERCPQFRGQVAYLGIMSPTRGSIPAYQQLREEVGQLADEINERYATPDWKPIHLVDSGASREEVMDLYRRCAACLVTPLDDGMNLVSKEFVVAASTSDNPGMLVLSQFAGSATDLAPALIVNPYDRNDVASAIEHALTMPVAEKRDRIQTMLDFLRENSVYSWAISFVHEAIDTVRRQQYEVMQVR